MVTTTTKTLNYSITKGSSTNSVNATITSTPGFNSNYLGKLPGILKILELILAVVALGLVASMREEMQPVEVAPPSGTTEYDNWRRLCVDTRVTPSVVTCFSYWREIFMIGEVYFLCAHSAVITLLMIFLITYLFHTTSAMIVPKATNLENVAHLILALLLLAAGITEIAITEYWKVDRDRNPDRPLMTPRAEAMRVAAGAVAILNAILFIVSFVMSKKELQGPKTL